MTALLPAPAADGWLVDADTAERDARHRRMLGRAVVVLLLGGWFALLGPAFLGGPATYVIVAGDSMHPTMNTGDLVIARAASTYDVGQVVVYRVPGDGAGAGSGVIHRIVGGSAQGYITQGDNRANPDGWRPDHDDVVGRAVLRVPALGTVVARLRAPLPLAVIAGLLTIWFIGFDGKPRRRE